LHRDGHSCAFRRTNKIDSPSWMQADSFFDDAQPKPATLFRFVIFVVTSIKLYFSASKISGLNLGPSSIITNETEPELSSNTLTTNSAPVFTNCDIPLKKLYVVLERA
jgi:hypothetical protein